VRPDIHKVDAIKSWIVDEGCVPIDVSGDDGVSGGTPRVVAHTKAFGLHPALCEEGVLESRAPEGHRHGWW
jgi:hypothetical protein